MPSLGAGSEAEPVVKAVGSLGPELDGIWRDAISINIQVGVVI
jgi:hypothetical protein